MTDRFISQSDYSRGEFQANQNLTAITSWPSQPMGYFSSSQKTKKDVISQVPQAIWEIRPGDL